jgi:CheY-like chemotaxis protein
MMSDTQEPAAYVAAAVADLIFGARVRAAAEQAGVAVRFIRSMEEVVAAGAGARLVLLDLDAKWLDAPVAITALLGQDVPPRIVAFVSHVRGDAIEAARAAGAERVLARSAFVRQLPELLRA